MTARTPSAVSKREIQRRRSGSTASLPDPPSRTGLVDAVLFSTTTLKPVRPPSRESLSSMTTTPGF
jgi:hypothetical protein